MQKRNCTDVEDVEALGFRDRCCSSARGVDSAHDSRQTVDVTNVDLERKRERTRETRRISPSGCLDRGLRSCPTVEVSLIASGRLTQWGFSGVGGSDLGSALTAP